MLAQLKTTGFNKEQTLNEYNLGSKSWYHYCPSQMSEGVCVSRLSVAHCAMQCTGSPDNAQFFLLGSLPLPDQILINVNCTLAWTCTLYKFRPKCAWVKGTQVYTWPDQALFQVHHFPSSPLCSRPALECDHPRWRGAQVVIISNNHHQTGTCKSLVYCNIGIILNYLAAR